MWYGMVWSVLLDGSLLTVSVKYSDPFLGRYRAILFDTAAGSRCR